MILIICLLVIIVLYLIGFYDYKKFIESREIVSNRFEVVETKYGKIKYLDIGPKEGDVILFSGGGGTGIDLVYAFDWLTKKGYRLISVNRPGYYGLNVDVVDTLEGHADIYHDVIESLGIKEVNIFGLSMGALSALYYAAKYSTKSLVLWCPITGQYQVNQQSVNSPIGKLVMSKRSKNIISWMLSRFARLFPEVTIRSFLRAEANLDKNKINAIARDVMDSSDGRKSFNQFIDSMAPMSALYEGMMDEVEKSKKPSTINWDNITTPTFAVCSTADKDVSKDHFERIENKLENAIVKYVEAGGHFVWWGNEGEEVIQNTITFFDRYNR
ncbi:MAG: alpha/beta hydrolase [Clostridia bacterium]|nr:alpha/beta hydrolase [Clostridia bacterium]